MSQVTDGHHDAVCKNCGATLTGAYCAQCGQSAHDNHKTTIAHLFHELTHELLHVDGTIWRTLLTLMTRPGALTAEYWEGRRASWIRPFRVFLIAAAIHFVAVSGIGPMNLDILLRKTDAGDYNVAIGTLNERDRIRTPGTDVSEGERHEYLEKIRHVYAPVRYAAVPLFAVVSLLLYVRRQPFYADHLVFALHFYAFWYACSVIASPIPRATAAIIVSLATAAYLLLATRRLHHQGWLVSALKSVALFAFMLLLEMALAMVAAAWVGRTYHGPA